MSHRLRHFATAFCLGAILIGTILGFAAVDMNTDLYMPGLFQPLFAVMPGTDDGVTVSVMGHNFTALAPPPEDSHAQLYQWRGLLPPELRLVGAAVFFAEEKAVDLQKSLILLKNMRFHSFFVEYSTN